MIKTIFQIFYNFGRELDEFPIYIKSIEMWKEYCRTYNLTYLLFTREDCEKLVKKTKYYEFYQKLSAWSKMELMRYIVISQIPNSMYIDLDIQPKNYELFNYILENNDCITGQWNETISNSIIGFDDNKLIIPFIENCIIEYNRMTDIEIYKIWKIRKMKRSVGVSAFTKYFKDVKLIVELPLAIQDHETKEWLNKKYKGVYYD